MIWKFENVKIVIAMSCQYIVIHITDISKSEIVKYFRFDKFAEAKLRGYLHMWYKYSWHMSQENRKCKKYRW